MDLSTGNSYSVDGVIVVAVSSCVVMILAAMFIFWQFFATVDPYDHGASYGNSDMLSASAWCIAATLVVGVISYQLRRSVGRFAPSYLFIPIGSAFLFIFSRWFYLYWVARSRYLADDPFILELPGFGSVVLSAFFVSCLISAFSVSVAFVTLTLWQSREWDEGIHLS